ncbi:ubiquitin C-terminal hydrolase 12-like, partial [Macadamia integrifolia]|uniref:ubiquitin C-terminal hydrolase 12-like n=1 Tax=Macadamia integrifolia TaxID=60698 RepID=UPI001C4F7035
MAKCFGGLGSKPKKKCSSSSSFRPLLCNCNLDGSVFSPLKGPARSIRDAPPAHYVLKILSFSALTKEYNSSVFEAGGYKWKLCIYPKGNKHEKGENHISIYLVMADSNSLALGWEVKASFRFSLFNQIHCNYLTAKVHGRHFNEIKKEWGFARFISLGSFRKYSNG